SSWFDGPLLLATRSHGELAYARARIAPISAQTNVLEHSEQGALGQSPFVQHGVNLEPRSFVEPSAIHLPGGKRTSTSRSGKPIDSVLGDYKGPGHVSPGNHLHPTTDRLPRGGCRKPAVRSCPLALRRLGVEPKHEIGSRRARNVSFGKPVGSNQ